MNTLNLQLRKRGQAPAAANPSYYLLMALARSLIKVLTKTESREIIGYIVGDFASQTITHVN